MMRYDTSLSPIETQPVCRKYTRAYSVVLCSVVVALLAARYFLLQFKKEANDNG